MKLSSRTRKIIYAVLSVIALAYLGVSLCVVRSRADKELCKGVVITVHDTAELKFVRPRELAVDLKPLPQTALRTPLSKINIDSIELRLRRFDKIEDVNINVLNNGKIHIEVWPMRPVLRIFDQYGASYYLNRRGKRIAADPRYYVDVPVVSGDFSEIDSIPGFILPLVNRIENDSLWRNAITGYKIVSADEVILIPAFHGHVINFGSPSDADSKLRRLDAFYRKVMPVKGWNHYDTLSVRWAGQVVATRRIKEHRPDDVLPDSVISELDDPETMSAGAGIAPGQALPNHPAKSEKPVPGASSLHKQPQSSEHNKTN